VCCFSGFVSFDLILQHDWEGEISRLQNFALPSSQRQFASLIVTAISNVARKRTRCAQNIVRRALYDSLNYSMASTIYKNGAQLEWLFSVLTSINIIAPFISDSRPSQHPYVHWQVLERRRSGFLLHVEIFKWESGGLTYVEFFASLQPHTARWGCSVPSSARRYEQWSIPSQNTLRGHSTSPRLAACPFQPP
jgi:hypothetical protein